ncbi:MAG TPA: class II fructose-bisphosphate aldolase [Gammaproteobacteria bacterium]|nr:class II fructose-bisphosphate aldolase [Gammaproteobacteria bacterium]
MPLVNMRDMVDHAYRHSYAVGAFELVNLEFLQGVMAAAERCRAPVILSLAEPHPESLDFDLLVAAVECAAQRASVPVAIHLHHGRDLPSAVRAINAGCNGVMVDASHHELGEDIAITAEVVAMAQGCGVPVEGKLGYVPQAEGEGAQPDRNPPVYTSVAEARGYVDRTGVDFLAVSIGTVRGRTKAKPKLDWQRLKQINEALGIPLSIYGSSGLNNSQVRRLIDNGIAKIHYYTGLADAAFEQVRASTKGSAKGDYTGAMRAVQEVVEQETERCLRLWGAAGRAAEVSEQCSHWLPVEHEVTVDLEGLDESAVEAVMAEGRRVLATIPGVREVYTGRAVRDDALCRYSWLVSFCHPAAVDGYREHPAYVAFCSQRFRQIRRVGADPQLTSRRRAGADSPTMYLGWASQAPRG